MDISKSGEQIGEKLFALLSEKQKQELIQYVLTKAESDCLVVPTNDTFSMPLLKPDSHLTEIQAEHLYFCLDIRLVYIGETEIVLTVKEFDIFASLL